MAQLFNPLKEKRAMGWDAILIVYMVIAFAVFCYDIRLSKYSYYPIRAFAESLLRAFFWIFIFGDELIEYILSGARSFLRGRGF